MKKLFNQLWLLGLTVIVVVFLWILIPFVIAKYLNLTDLPKDVGMVGDMFGSVNALFAGLAFAGLLWSIIQTQKSIRIQQDELRLQREELKLQRKELVESRGVLKEQADSQREMTSAIRELASQTNQTRKASVLAALLQSGDDHLGRRRYWPKSIGHISDATKELFEEISIDLTSKENGIIVSLLREYLTPLDREKLDEIYESEDGDEVD